MIRITFLSLLFTTTIIAQDSTIGPVTQHISYKTKQAEKLYLVWALDNWTKLPEVKYWPNGSFQERNMVWSPMASHVDSFTISLSLPTNSYLNYMFWVPVDAKGDSSDGWDTYGEQTYFSEFKTTSRIRLNDEALWMPDQKTFSLFRSGWHFFIGAIAFAICMFAFSKRKVSFNIVGLFNGLIVSALLFSIAERFQMNKLLEKGPFKIFGAILHDVLWLLICLATFYIISVLPKKIRIVRVILTFLVTGILVCSILLSIFNVEIVKNIGRPINYQWLYYSDFLTGADAKHAISTNLTPQLLLHIILLFLAAIIIAIPFAITFIFNRRKFIVALFISLTALLATSYIQSRYVKFKAINFVNPTMELASSFITSETSSKLFTMQVSNSTKEYITAYHTTIDSTKIDSAEKIKNIILFVFESLPTNYVSLYDSSLNVTPNLMKWKHISAMYTNMYAHLPATVYSLASINSGVYPLISFKSLIAQNPRNNLPTLSEFMKNAGWKTSFFSAADLTYSNMKEYATAHDFEVVQDNRDIACRFPKYGNTNSFLDQLDDKCLSLRYFEWIDSVKNNRTFSLLWTGQTHYPYFTSAEKKYSSDEILNKYLNALHNADSAFGMLMNGLEKRNILESTLVVVTSDHGEAFGTHSQIAHASKIYEENMHVPFMLYNPVLFKSTLDTSIHGLIDIAPSIAHILGARKPSQWQGRSLFSKMADPRTFFICPFSEFLFGTRNGKWKYIYNAEEDEHELYDLQHDQAELNNIAKEFPGIVKTEHEMVAGWVQYHKAHINKWLQRKK